MHSGKTDIYLTSIPKFEQKSSLFLSPFPLCTLRGASRLRDRDFHGFFPYLSVSFPLFLSVFSVIFAMLPT